MVHLIDKDALVAEINNRLEKLWDSLPNASDVVKDNYTKEEANATGKYTALESFRDYINTLEVKEVDLEKEIDKFYGMYRKNGITFSIEDNQECLDWKVDCNPNFEKTFAKHFFELGMAVNNKAQKGEEI